MSLGDCHICTSKGVCTPAKYIPPLGAEVYLDVLFAQISLSDELQQADAIGTVEYSQIHSDTKYSHCGDTQLQVDTKYSSCSKYSCCMLLLPC